MDNNNLYGQENQNGEQGQYQQPYQQGQPYQQEQQYQQPYQQQQYQQPYQQQVYHQPYQGDNNGLEEPVSFGDWMLTILLMCIPCVNIVMMFVWAFGSNTKKSKSNYFKAALIWALIGIAIGVVLSIILALVGVSLFNNFY